MVPFIFLGALAMSIIAGTIQARATSPERQKEAAVVLGVCLVLLVLCIGIGLWQAWVPYEINLERS